MVVREEGTEVGEADRRATRGIAQAGIDPVRFVIEPLRQQRCLRKAGPAAHLDALIRLALKIGVDVKVVCWRPVSTKIKDRSVAPNVLGMKR